MARKRHYTVSEAMEACKTLAADPSTGAEWRAALAKCFSILVDCDIRAGRNDALRAKSNQTQSSEDRRRQLETLIKQYQAQHDREVPLGNVRLGEMMRGWKAELAAIVAAA